VIIPNNAMAITGTKFDINRPPKPPNKLDLMIVNQKSDYIQVAHIDPINNLNT